MADTKGERVFDVTKPGKTAPDPTSRPVIVGHGTTMARDPMVSEPGSSSDAETKVPEPAGQTKSPSVKREKVVAAPSDFTKAPDAQKDEAKADAPQTPATEAGSDQAAVDAVADQAADRKKDNAVAGNEESEEDKARREHIAALASSKTYFLPIGRVTHKKNVRKSLIAVVVLLAAGGAAAYYAYSMGLLKNLK